MNIDFITDDVLHWANTYHGPKFHSLLCDPPYELAFMGKKWDATGIAFKVDTWAALAEHLLPGAFLMAFGGSRTYHRMACAIEDAGLIIHPAISYLYGSGFPKATRIDTQIDKAAGAERETVGKVRGMGKQNPQWNGTAQGRKENSLKSEYDATVPSTSLARTWAGHRYGLQALKPAAEFICVAQKPYQGKPVESIVESGAGALNIEGARIATDLVTEDLERGRANNALTEFIGKAHEGFMSATPPSGRWPANLLLDSDAARVLDEMSGERRSSGIYNRGEMGDPSGAACIDIRPPAGIAGYSDSGGASRFFFTYQSDALDDADPFMQNACAICGRKHGIMNETQQENIPCKHAKSAETNSSPSTRNNGSVQTDVLPPGQQDNGAKPGKCSLPVNGAEKFGKITPVTTGDIAAGNVQDTSERKNVQAAKSAGNLCERCATAIVQSIAQMQQDPGRGLHLYLDYIADCKNRILNLCLALSVASLENTGITQIIQDPITLSGCVKVAIANYTENAGLDQTRFTFHSSVAKRIADSVPFRYQSKASRRERDAGLDALPVQNVRHMDGGDFEGNRSTMTNGMGRNVHPTVKPLALCRYLATLLLPPAEYAPRRLLVPFGGVGSEAIGAMQAGWDEITAIEREAEYVEIGRARAEYWRKQVQQLTLPV